MSAKWHAQVFTETKTWESVRPSHGSAYEFEDAASAAAMLRNYYPDVLKSHVRVLNTETGKTFQCP